MKKKLSIIASACFMLIFIFACNPVQAAAEEAEQLNIEIVYGYDNYQKVDRPIPVRIRVENTGNAFSGKIRLSINDKNYEAIAFEKPLSVLSDSETEVLFVIPYVYSYTGIQLDIYNSNDENVYSEDYLSLNRNTDDIYAGILSNNVKSLDYFEGLVFYISNIMSYKAMRTTDITNYSFPDTFEGLKSMDMLIAEDYDFSALDYKQSSALKSWLENGGILITGRSSEETALFDCLKITEPEILGTKPVSTTFNIENNNFVVLTSPLPRAVLPENPTEEEKIQLQNPMIALDTASFIPDESTQFIKDKVSLDIDMTKAKPDENIIDKEFYQEIAVGRGKIVSFKFDLGKGAFAQWDGRAYAIQQQLSEILNQNNLNLIMNQSFVDSAWNIHSTLLNSLNADLPGISVYALVLCIYIIIIGPVIYFMLKKADKRHLLWIIIPVSAVLCTLIIFNISHKTRRVEPFVNYASILSFDEHKTERTYFSTTIPNKNTYHFEIDSSWNLKLLDNSLYSSGSMYMPINIENKSNSDVCFDMTSKNTDIIINNQSLFNTKYFATYREGTAEGIEADIKYSDSSYFITITNNTDYTLNNAAFYIAGIVYPAGDVEKHGSISLELPVSENTEDYDLYAGYCNTLGIDPKHELSDAEAAVKLNLLLQLSNTYSPGSTYLTGFLDGYPLDMLNNSDYSAQGLTLMHKTINISYTQDDGSVYIPDINTFLTVDSGDIFGQPIYLSSNEAYVSYNLDNHIDITRLSLNDEKSKNVSTAIYNYKSGQYEEVFDGVYTLDSSILKDYLDKNNIMKVKFIKMAPDGRSFPLIPVFSVYGREQNDSNS